MLFPPLCQVPQHVQSVQVMIAAYDHSNRAFDNKLRDYRFIWVFLHLDFLRLGRSQCRHKPMKQS